MIYHYSSTLNYWNIMQKGLIFSKKSYGYMWDTGAINKVLESYRPDNLPDYINRDRCIFFYPFERKEEVETFGSLSIVVDPKNLDLSKLFVFSHEDADRIWGDVIDAPESGEYSEIPLEVSAKNYWDSMTPYQDWKGDIENFKKYEILYFGEIPLSKFKMRNKPPKEILDLKKHMQEYCLDPMECGITQLQFSTLGEKRKPIAKADFFPKNPRFLFTVTNKEEWNKIEQKVLSFIHYPHDIKEYRVPKFLRDWDNSDEEDLAEIERTR